MFETGLGGANSANYASSTDAATNVALRSHGSTKTFVLVTARFVVENAPNTSIIDLIGVARGILILAAPHIALSFRS